MTRAPERIRDDIRDKPEPVSEIGGLARVNATGEPPEGAAKAEVLDIASASDAPHGE
ncbi:MAG TPA: hypothetical protein VM370_01695 [Candidatus Thermoplasmatota archaeon]|nr:hypothetical protein [Candidatus Thermoplasmatota archaeon]